MIKKDFPGLTPSQHFFLSSLALKKENCNAKLWLKNFFLFNQTVKSVMLNPSRLPKLSMNLIRCISEQKCVYDNINYYLGQTLSSTFTVIFPTVIHGSFSVINCRRNLSWTFNSFRAIGINNCFGFRFSFRCCRNRHVIAHTCKHTVIKNNWDQPLRYVVPSRFFLVGAFSEHNNGKQ